MPSPAPGHAGVPASDPPTPVFVDDSGRRHRFVRGFGWALAAVVTVYLALLGVSLVGSPGLVPLSLPAVGKVLPGPAAPLVSDGSGSGRSAGELVPTAATPGARIPAGPATAVVTAAVPLVARRQSHSRTGTGATTTSAPTPRSTPTATPAPTHTSQGKGTPQASPRPTHSSTAHPTPHSTHAAGASALTAAGPTTTATP